MSQPFGIRLASESIAIQGGKKLGIHPLVRSMSVLESRRARNFLSQNLRRHSRLELMHALGKSFRFSKATKCGLIQTVHEQRGIASLTQIRSFSWRPAPAL